MLQLPGGKHVMADERFFLIAKEGFLSRDGWTTQEAEVMVDHRWWSQDEMAQTSATIWPDDLLMMLRTALPR